MPDNVHKLKDEPVAKVIASGVNIVIGLTDDRQISFQTGFEGDESDASINARFDRMMRFADRLKARYGMKKLTDEIKVRERALANFVADKARIEHDHEIAQADRQVQVDELCNMKVREIAATKAFVNEKILDVQKKRAAEYDKAQDEHQKRGKMAPFKPIGATKVNLERCDQALAELGKERDAEVERLADEFDERVEKAVAEIVRVEADRAQHATNLEDTMTRHVEELAAAKAELDDLKALAEG